MTEQQTEILALLYSVGDAIHVKDWGRARVIWERVLLMYAPLGEMQPHLETVLRHQETLMHLAERQASKYVH